MGLDYGSKTVGIAVSDPFGWTAQPIETITRKDEANLVSTIERMKSIIEAFNIEKIVLGLPKNMNNSIGPQAEKTLQFVKQLKKKIIFYRFLKA